MKSWLILGAAGALGSTLMAALAARGADARGFTRADGDVSEAETLRRALRAHAPDVVINCAAVVDLAACEADPARAWRVHAAPARTLAAWSQETHRPFVQISTDQVLGAGAGPHDEEAIADPVNQYGRSKRAGELFALESPRALVVRTSLTTARARSGAKPPFAAWALHAIETRAPLALFSDYVCSTIDAGALAEAVIDLAQAGASGVLNVAAREAASKAHFVHALASRLGVRLDWAAQASAAGLSPQRRIACALDVSRAEALLGRALPDLDAVARALAAQWLETRRYAA